MERIQQLQDEKGKKKHKVLKSRFKLKRDSEEAQQKIQKLSRKEKKKLLEEYKRLHSLSQREL
jgi:hypothetical protein